MKQAAFIIGMASCWLIPFSLVGLNLWTIMFAVVIAVVILFELISLYTTKKETGKSRTLSQQFWDFSRLEPRKAVAVLAAITVGWIALIWHLAEKLDRAQWKQKA